MSILNDLIIPYVHKKHVDIEIDELKLPRVYFYFEKHSNKVLLFKHDDSFIYGHLSGEVLDAKFFKDYIENFHFWHNQEIASLKIEDSTRIKLDYWNDKLSKVQIGKIVIQIPAEEYFDYIHFALENGDSVAMKSTERFDALDEYYSKQSSPDEE